jgi:hypothetical protein
MLLVTRRPFWSCAIVLLALPAAAAPLDTKDLLRCHAIASRDERLDCYEALAMSAQSAATTAPEPAHSATSAAATTAAGATATAGYAPAGNAAAAAGSATPPTAAAIPETEANFGLNRREIEPEAQKLGSIKSVVSQMTEDRRHNITVVLDNGQTWSFIEPEPRLRPGDTVTIRHASLGSFLMLTPSRRSYRVERLK